MKKRLALKVCSHPWRYPMRGRTRTGAIRRIASMNRCRKDALRVLRALMCGLDDLYRMQQ